MCPRNAYEEKGTLFFLTLHSHQNLTEGALPFEPALHAQLKYIQSETEKQLDSRHQ